MSKISSIGSKRQIPFWTALVFFAVAAGYVCENRLVQNGIFSLSSDQENIDRLLVFCPNSSIKFWLRLFVPCFSHFFARCAASNPKIASPDPKIHYPKFNELLVQNT